MSKLYVYQITSIDWSLAQDAPMDELECFTEGNVICASLAKAKALCEQDEAELADECGEEYRPLSWTTCGKTVSAESRYSDTVYSIIKTEVQS